MISTNLNQSSLPLKKRNQDQSHLPTTNNSYPCPVFFDTVEEEQDANGTGKLHGHDQYHQQQQQEKPNHDQLLLINGSSDFLQSFSTNSSNNNDKIDQYFCDGDHDELDGHGSVKWMSSSKMQWMRKMMGSEQTIMSKPRRSMEGLQGKRLQNQESSSNISSGINIRVCSDCSTTKTPLWRTGPRGPKSLCNACGIRQRKARRAMMAAAGSGLVATNSPTKVKKRAAGDRTIPSKKRRKITNTETAHEKKLQIDDLMINLSDNSAFHRVFPQDEKDAAILLMALSCGTIHG